MVHGEQQHLLLSRELNQPDLQQRSPLQVAGLLALLHSQNTRSLLLLSRSQPSLPPRFYYRQEQLAAILDLLQAGCPSCIPNVVRRLSCCCTSSWNAARLSTCCFRYPCMRNAAGIKYAVLPGSNCSRSHSSLLGKGERKHVRFSALRLNLPGRGRIFFPSAVLKNSFLVSQKGRLAMTSESLILGSFCSVSMREKQAALAYHLFGIQPGKAISLRSCFTRGKLLSWKQQAAREYTR